jgi:CRISPR/Cas system CSM-associated protein Csm3 (group 7 of RAMP superfamily)
LLDWRGLPFIPGSSLKGRLRHTCKQLAEGLDLVTCAEPRAETMCPNGPIPDDYCPVCRLFGSIGNPSPLTISDLPLVEPEFLTQRARPLPTSLRYGVGISRRRRVAEDNLLFDTEVFTPGGPVTYAGEIRGEVDENGLGLLVAGLENLFTLGNSKTSGLGWFQPNFTVYQVTNKGQDEQRLSVDEIKQRWLK